MFIYLDANLAQYYADYQDFILGNGAATPINEPLLKELEALHQIIELEQLGEGWHVCAPKALNTGITVQSRS